jgi:transcriptional regulator with XRE-family HTH domain
VSDFGKRLRTIREAKGITLYRLAHLTGLSKQGVINLEDEDADPKLSTLIKLAEALNVKPWELLPSWKGKRSQTESAASGVRGEEADEELLHGIWDDLHDAWEAALQGQVARFQEAFGLTYEAVQDETPSTSRRWHVFADELRLVLEEVLPEIEAALKLASSWKKVIPTARKRINASFRELDDCFCPFPEEWIGDWKQEREGVEAKEPPDPEEVVN